MKKHSSLPLLMRAASHALLAFGLLAGAFTASQAQAQGTVPVAELSGSYLGYIAPSTLLGNKAVQAAPPPSSIPNEDLGARIDLFVASTGAVTGKLAFGPTSIALKGAFTVVDGRADIVLRLPITAFSRTIQLTFNTATNVASGTFAYGLGDVLVAGQELSVYKNVWSGRTPPTAFTAYQTFRIIQGKSLTLNSNPQGFGFGSLKSGTVSGNYNIVGTLADGQKYTTAGFYGSQGEVVVYQYLYSTLGGGVVVGGLRIRSGVAETREQVDTSPSLNGSVTWIKRSSPRITLRPRGPTTWKRYAPRPVATEASSLSADTLYPDGFTLFASVNGAPYTAPAPGQILLVDGVASIGPPASVSTGIYFGYNSRFSGVNFYQPFSITNPSPTATTNLVTLATPVRNSVRITQYDVTTGLFKGTFTLTPPLRAATFEGILVKGLGINYQGYGYFIIRDLKSSVTLADVPTQLSDQRVSGQVVITND